MQRLGDEGLLNSTSAVYKILDTYKRKEIGLNRNRTRDLSKGNRVERELAGLVGG